jgi:hypothetical protein
MLVGRPVNTDRTKREIFEPHGYFRTLELVRPSFAHNPTRFRKRKYRPSSHGIKQVAQLKLRYRYRNLLSAICGLSPLTNGAAPLPEYSSPKSSKYRWAPKNENTSSFKSAWSAALTCGGAEIIGLPRISAASFIFKPTVTRAWIVATDMHRVPFLSPGWYSRGYGRANELCDFPRYLRQNFPR